MKDLENAKIWLDKSLLEVKYLFNAGFTKYFKVKGG
jgi:hypothetical protein